MKITHDQVKHESETQRQHVRLPLPARVEIGGNEYMVKDLSSGGLAAREITGNFTKGQHIPLNVKLPFGSFSLDMNFEAEIQHYSPQEKTLGCVFINLTAEHISLLNYILKAFMAGDIIASGDLLNIAGRDNFTKSRKQAASAAIPDFKKQLPGLAVVMVIGILLAVFIAGNLYNSLFLVKAANAVVSGPIMNVRAATDGIYNAKLDPELTVVKTNQLIGTLASHGSSVELRSPCDCYVAGVNASDGDFVSSGKQIVSLVPLTAKPWIMAEIDPSQAVKIGTDTKVSVTVFGTKAEYTGHVVSMESNLADQSQSSGSRPITMKILADQKIPVNLTNRPAAVIFSVH